MIITPTDSKSLETKRTLDDILKEFEDKGDRRTVRRALDEHRVRLSAHFYSQHEETLQKFGLSSFQILDAVAAYFRQKRPDVWSFDVEHQLETRSYPPHYLHFLQIAVDDDLVLQIEVRIFFAEFYGDWGIVVRGVFPKRTSRMLQLKDLLDSKSQPSQREGDTRDPSSVSPS